MNDFILLEDRLSQTESDALFFSDAAEDIICFQAADLLTCLERIDVLRQCGHYLAGFISYEAGYFLKTPFSYNTLHLDPSFPLLHFRAFKHVDRLNSEAVVALLNRDQESDIQITNLRLNCTEQKYVHNFSKVKQLIYDGHTYQVNLTAKYLFELEGSPLRFYQKLRDRQKVRYSGLLQFNNYQILSLSPELFFKKIGGTMHVEPMKGTTPRDKNPIQDLNNKQFLTTDIKSIAENTMIVDLLRNDLSSLSYPGTVDVLSLLNVTSYETLHQMTSTIESQVDPDLTFKTIISQLFPCGSITGVPKRRTMEIINDLEQCPRNVYTGAIGYITPTNDMCFNVPIRTILLRNNQGELGVGGGIVYDSDAQGEFEELKLKARFFTQMEGCNE